MPWTGCKPPPGRGAGRGRLRGSVGSNGLLAAALEVGADLDASVRDRSPEGLDLAREAFDRRDVVLVIVERRQQHAVVGERADVVLSALVAAGDLLEEVEHGHVRSEERRV